MSNYIDELDVTIEELRTTMQTTRPDTPEYDAMAASLREMCRLRMEIDRDSVNHIQTEDRLKFDIEKTELEQRSERRRRVMDWVKIGVGFVSSVGFLAASLFGDLNRMGYINNKTSNRLIDDNLRSKKF